jgi:hypothetical protein
MANHWLPQVLQVPQLRQVLRVLQVLQVLRVLQVLQVWQLMMQRLPYLLSENIYLNQYRWQKLTESQRLTESQSQWQIRRRESSGVEHARAAQNSFSQSAGK